jgi:AcrR family transcriptional regulator
VAQTQEERKAETRGRLLDAAAALFAEQGIDGVSVDAVAGAAGRTSGAVYAHFGSKQGLLLAVLDAWRQSVVTVLSAEVALSDSPAAQLAAVWDNVASPSADTPGRWALLEHELWLRASRDPEVAEALRRRTADGLRHSGGELSRWAASVGAHPVGDPEETVILVKALMTGLEMQRRIEPGSVPDDLAVRGLAALVGLPGADRARPAGRPRASSGAGEPPSRPIRPRPGHRRAGVAGPSVRTTNPNPPKEGQRP